MPDRFKGRRVVLTGASRGIGRGIAERFAAEGADLVLVARTVDSHDHLAGSLRETAEVCQQYGVAVHLMPADMSDADSRAAVVPRAIELLGGVDILVNNAAAAIYSDLLTYPLKRRRISFEVNVEAPMDLIQATLPAMQARGEGWIVNVSSAGARYEDGRRRATPPVAPDHLGTDMAVYAASKAALNRLTVALATALAGSGVRINTVEPGSAVMTEGTRALMGDSLDPSTIEPLEAMVEGTLVLCDCAPEVTGGIHDSLGLLEWQGTTVMTLDGTRPYTPPSATKRA